MELTLDSAFSIGGMVGHASYLLLVISMMMQRISLLRILVIASAVLAILYDGIWLKDPVGVFWESTLVLVNIVQLLLLHWKNVRAQFSEDENAFIRGRLPNLSKGKSRDLLSAGHWFDAEDGIILTNQGSNVQTLTYIARGRVNIYVNNVRVSRCGAGDFIGEMTVLTKEPATATTVVAGSAVLWQIDHDNLVKLMRKYPDIQTELDASFARNYRDKLIHSNLLIAQGVVP